MRLVARASWVALPLVAVALVPACTKTDPDSFSGYAEGEFVYVAPAVSGRLQSVEVQRGQRVERGAPLFHLDPDPESYERAAAVARAQQAAATASNLRKGKRADELKAVEQQLEQARAALALSTSELERNTALVKQGFQSPGKLDELRAARDRDAAHVAEMQATLAVARAAARPDEIAAAEAGQRAAESDLKMSRWREQQTRGAAPVNGVVQDVTYRPGEWVAQGAPVVTLLPDGAVKLRFFAPQAALSRIAPGDTVQVRCDGCPSGLTAQVRFISTEAEFTPPVIYSNESRSKLVFMVEAQPQGEAASRLRPGQPVDVHLAR
jgi:HlyD family secretion protein